MRTLPNVIILKTDPRTLGGVIDHQKHALRGKLKKAQAGDLLLIAVKQPSGSAEAQYAMWFKTQRHAGGRELDAIWGEGASKRWKYIIEGDGCNKLTNPFRPQKKNDGRGGTIKYVEPTEAEAFARDGLLQPFIQAI